MPAITIPCPACGSSLKMPDTSLVGKKAKCPKCEHRFIVALPGADEVPLQLADVPVLPLAPQPGTSARWVPDEAPPMVSAPGPWPAAPDNSGASAGRAVAGTFPVPGPVADTPNPALDFAVAEEPSGTATERLIPRRARRGNRTTLVAITLLSLVVVGGGYAAFVFNKAQPEQSAGPLVNENWEAKKLDLAASNESAEALSPTSGKNIPLDYLPFTPQFICHLHPAEIWKKNDRTTVEFVAILGDLGIWLKDQIESRTGFQPEDINELTFAVNFGARMSQPDVAVVVRLREPQIKSNLIQNFKDKGGRRRPDPNVELYDSEDQNASFLLLDNQTFAVAPISVSEELALSTKDPALVSPDMEVLLKESDRDRHVTVLFDLSILDAHREDVFMQEMQDISDRFVLWIGDEVETVSWSMHLEPNFFMETLFHNASDSSILKVHRHAQLQFSRLPERILSAVRMMRPGTVGSRQVIGRFPAMLQALDVGTTAHVAPDCARLVTVLPRNASVNLAAGILLTWNQSLLTNFDEVIAKPAEDKPLPDKIVERLELPVLVDFRRMPLQEAFGYIGESIKTEVSIDGDALKGAGFTQNMPQTLDLGTVSAKAALHAIYLKYAPERDPLVFIVDEKGKKLLLSTGSKAKADGLTVFDTSPKN